MSAAPNPGPGPDATSPVVVGLLYPTQWYGDPDGFAAEVAALEALDPRIEVVVEAYDEPHEVRTGRGGTDADAWRDRAPTLTDAQRAALARCEVVVAIDLPFDVATVAPHLRWVQAVGAGTAQLQSAGLGAAGIRLTTSAGSNAVGIAEFVVGRLLEERKRFRELHVLQQEHHWDPLYGTELAGTTACLVGLGAINAAVARRLQAFDVHVLATRRSAAPGATADDVDELHPTSELHAVLGRADAVVAAVPETPETIGMFDRDTIRAIKPGAFFCNVGRGTLLDETALVEALRDGHLRGAALDVASAEPLPADHPLWDAPNLYLSYHNASAPGALFRNLHRLLRDNLTRYLAGEPLRNEVDLGRGY